MIRRLAMDGHQCVVFGMPKAVADLASIATALSLHDACPAQQRWQGRRPVS
jgi:chemotaxis response regulator CheB